MTKMRLFAEIDRNPSRRKLLGFGAVMLVAFEVWAVTAFRHSGLHAAELPALIGVFAFAIAQAPIVGRRAYILWMGLGLVLGQLTAPVVLLVIYVLFVVPVAIAFRLRGRDSLRLRRAAATYWEDYPRAEGLASYFRQS